MGNLDIFIVSWDSILVGNTPNPVFFLFDNYTIMVIWRGGHQATDPGGSDGREPSPVLLVTPDGGAVKWGITREFLQPPEVEK